MPELLQEDILIVSSIMVKNSTVTEKEIISLVCLEGFWGFLKWKLALKGGITKQKLPLYLAEYVWRFNHRKDNNDNIKVKRIIKLLEHEV
jgi:hypothetical protein